MKLGQSYETKSYGNQSHEADLAPTTTLSHAAETKCDAKL